MEKFVESGDKTIFAINFDSLERLVIQTIMYIFISDKLKTDNMSYDDSINYEKLAKKFNDRLFLGFIGNRNKDIKIDLSVDEIRKLFLITMEAYNIKKDENYILKEKVNQMEIEGLEKNKIIEMKKELMEHTKDYHQIMELNQKFLKFMKNNSIYFFKDSNE